MSENVKFRRNTLFVSRMPKAIKDRLAEIARRDQLSMSAYIERLVLADFKRRGEKVSEIVDFV